MLQDSSTEATKLLRKIEDGDMQAQERLLAVLYDDLRRIAGGFMAHERPDHTLQPTALVNEAMSRLLAQEIMKHLPSKRYFYAAAVRAMRQVLVDHARQRRTAKRGGNRNRVPLPAAPAAG